jgi:vacuolar-type H+-ATPase subunit H
VDVTDSFDMLRVILATEAEVGAQVEAARRECEDLLRQTEEACHRAVREASDGREALRESAARDLVGQSEEKARRLREGAKARIAAMQARAEGRMDEAVAAVVRCVLQTDTGEGETP